MGLKDKAPNVYLFHQWSAWWEPACERKAPWIGWQNAWQLEVRWIINNKVTTLGCPRASPQADTSTFHHFHSPAQSGLPSLLIQKTGLRDSLGKVRSEKDRMKAPLQKVMYVIQRFWIRYIFETATFKYNVSERSIKTVVVLCTEWVMCTVSVWSWNSSFTNGKVT